VEEDKVALSAVLEEQGYTVQDLSNNEMAKAHTRHISGGRTPVAFSSILSSLPLASQSADAVEKDQTLYEVVYRFEFPEAPGALNKFLDTLSHFNQGWSISLFHYRNRGHDYGRVLVGLLVRGQERAAFQTFLEQLGYTFYDETENSSYKLFMQ
jgi:threonine dehydratase